MTDSLHLTPDRLRRVCNPKHFDFATTDELPALEEIVGQDRALEAIRLGVGIGHGGYNLFVLGPAGAGKRTMLERIIGVRANAEPAPDGWCYVNDFEQPHKPRALRLPPGRATTLRREMDQFVEELKVVIPATFESESYRARAQRIDTEFNECHEHAFAELGDEAQKQNVALIRTPMGFSLAPMHGGDTLNEEDYEALPEKERAAIESSIAGLKERLEKLLRQVPFCQRGRRWFSRVWNL